MLTQTDAIALYLDTGHSQAGSPQTSSYYFLVGLHMDYNYPSGPDTPTVSPAGPGTGSGWNTNWPLSSGWSDYSGAQWSCNPGMKVMTCG